MEKVKLGIIGMGSMGCQYAEKIVCGEVPDMELAAVTRIKAERREWANSVLPGKIKIFQTAEELLACKEINAVLIATPHNSHPDLTIEAFRRGLHVLCDKPAGVAASQARN